MSDPPRSRVEALFHELLPLSWAEREAAFACLGDEALAGEVRELLRAHESSPEFLDPPLVESMAVLDGELPLGACIGEHHQITQRLGSGGMGHVYRARHLTLERDDAIKILSGAANPRVNQRLVEEGQKAARLSHPNICTIYHVGEHQGRAYLVMELVAGVTLQERLRGGRLPFDAIRRYATQIAGALSHAHRSGVIHGDLKPANIMITPHGEVKVVDFGVARLASRGEEDDETRAEVPMAGTPRYMPPEMLRGGRVDERADVWALGAVIYEMAAGVPPFSGGSAVDLESSILRDEPKPLPPDVPPAIRTVVRRCLEKEAGRRYQTAAEVRAVLETEPAPAARGGTWWRAAAALLAAAVASLVFWAAAGPAPRSRVSIAVLPLESLSGPADEYFADGVTEVLIGDLAQVQALRVISRQSTLGFRGTKTPPQEIARALGVDYLVRGTVTRAGPQVRVTAHLLDPSSDEHLWTANFTRPVGDVLTLQNEVAREIARKVAVTIRPEEERRFAETRPVRPEVAEAYLKGRALWSVRSQRALEDAAEAFRAAIRLDPEHAPSHAGLADTYAVQASLEFVPAGIGYPNAREAAEAALRLDPGLAEPYAAIARVKFSYEWDGEAAEEAFRRALAINSGYATARQWYAVFLATRGRLSQALTEARLAQESNPLSPVVHWNVARTHYFHGAAAAAHASIARALELDPDFAMAHVLAARVHAGEGRLDAAKQALARIRAEDVSVEARSLEVYLAARGGDRRTALAALRRLESAKDPLHGSPYHLAKVYAALQEKEKALAHLERAVAERSSRAVFMAVDPELAPLRAEPRFEELTKRVDVAGAR